MISLVLINGVLMVWILSPRSTTYDMQPNSKVFHSLASIAQGTPRLLISLLTKNDPRIDRSKKLP
jgi:hypothetical protein